ncbi:CE1759 family FMN reductase [Streptomyces montanisoli]|uniref:NAD(P)H-dependent oxidoreductase n=1 Tax=Streptomyces montanisoli TaxID=2798581 RepID=A0A940S0X8_9ACTN|nr:CE1759 family FMN reductase [Streptomyces montanisoli]MBP0461768.1 NAD(P)H-dependent oxidoreductase [Streptomyces montanisoli]
MNTDADTDTDTRDVNRTRLVAVTAGVGKPSSTRLLTDRLVAGVSEHLDADVRVVELRDLAMDIAGNVVSGWPSQALREALEAVSDADGLIVATPVFAGSYSGLFKSFFDLVEPDALTGTPVLLAATGGTARHSLVVEHALRPLFSYLHALTLPTAVFAATDDWGAGADTHAGGLPGRVARASREFAQLLGRTRGTTGTVGVAPAATVPAATVPPARAEGGEAADGEAADEVVPFARLLADLA